MSAVQYPFIDIAVHEHVRDRFAAGEAIILFSRDKMDPLWCNGRGADLFGFDSIYDFLDQGPNRNDIAFRQIETAAGQLGAAGDVRHLMIRVASGFQRVPIQAACELIRIQGETAVLFSAPVEKSRLSLSARAVRMIEGFDDPDTHMAVLDKDGEVLAASAKFTGLGISNQTAKMLASMAGNDPSRLVKRPIPTAKGYLPAAIGRLSDEPALNLLFTVETGAQDRTAVDDGLKPVNAAAAAHASETDTNETTGSSADEPDEDFTVEAVPAAGFEDVIAAVSEIEDTEELEEEISLQTDEVSEISAHAFGGNSQNGEARAEETSDAVPASVVGPEISVRAEPEPVAVADEASTLDPAGFVFRRDGRAIRFVWKIDATGRFSEVSSEFADAVGPNAANINGMGFGDLAALFGLDPDGKIAELLNKRDTWSGKTIWWPVEGTSLVVPVDLAALPTYTRTREFDGFRGFGIVRIGDAAEDPNAIGLTLTPNLPEDVAGSAEDTTSQSTGSPSTAFELENDEPAVQPEEAGLQSAPAVSAADEQGPVDDEAETAGEPAETEVTVAADDQPADEPKPVSLSGRQAPSLLDWPEGEKPALRIVENPGRRYSDKVVQLEEHRSTGRERLTPVEQAAFREIARQLDSFIDRRTEEKAPEPPVAPPASEAGETEPVAIDPVQDAELSQDEKRDVVQQDSIDAPSADLPETPDVIEEPPAAAAEDASGEQVAPIADETNQSAAETEDEPVDGSEEEAIGPGLEISDRELLNRMIPVRERIGLSAEIVDQMPVALLIHSGDQLIHGNPEFLRLTGYASLEELVEVGGLDALLQRQDLEGKTAEAGGMVVVRSDDAVVPVTARLQSIRWGDSTALMLALMPVVAESAISDSAEAGEVIPLRPRRPADQLAKLQVEVEELRAILETATDGVVIIGADGDIRSLNRAASGLFNYDNEEIDGKPFVTLFAHESQRAILDYLGGLSGHGVASVLNDGREVIGREASGGFLPLFMTIGKLTSSNGYCAVIRDITQWKRTEEELRTAKRSAETANAHKSEFLAHVSHEIRTPLNAIIGFADMMATERFGPIGHPRYVEYANDIGRSGRHVLDIVNDLLDISKIEAGEMELDFIAVGLNETVSEAVSLVQPQANSQRVIIRTALSHAVPQVVADLRSVKQIVLNILSNAIRFTPSGGQIVVSTAYEANGNVVLRIRDTGIGMTRPELELAMKPFRQVAGGTRKRGDGTGLGLPLTKAMVDANRASFSITSAPNEGTLVEITFPSPRVLAN